MKDAIDIKNECYSILLAAQAAGKMPKDAVIKNWLKGGGIIRYKRSEDMISICVTDMMTTGYERRREIQSIAYKLLKGIIDQNRHVKIFVD
jgi:hypothetical protein